MAQHVITIVVTADDPDFSSAVEDAVAALQADGYTPTEVRVASDAGESVVAVPTEESETPPDGGSGGEEAPPATTAVENPGINGDFQPSGCATPTVAELTSLPVTAEPDTAWGTGSYMAASDGDAYWDGTAWTSGKAP